MCNGHSTRTSVGGIIAILKPRSTTVRPTLERELSFRLIEDEVTGATTAAIDGLVAEDGKSQITIQYVLIYPVAS